MAPSEPLAAYLTLASPWGPVALAASALGVCAAELRAEPVRFAAALARRLGGPVLPASPAVPAPIRTRLAAASGALAVAFEGRPGAPERLALDWRGVADWDRRVLEGTRAIPRGGALGYGQLAQRIGAPGAARAVGAALGRNPFWILVPCHRVIAGDGRLGGYGGGEDALAVKRDLLALEGTTLPAALPPA